jgi:pimeloyl-ACP methyl ester carboxylesterase
MPTHIVERDGVQLCVRVEGEGPTILFLHGWPDTGIVWNDVAALCQRAGYRVLLADLRGCGMSSKPDATEAYAMAQLVGDVAAIIDQLGEGPVLLVGHDWGANLAWATTAFLPALVQKVAVLSVGHPTSFRSAGLSQQIKSWYTLLFWHEGLGERFLRRNDYQAMREWLGHPNVDAVIAELERDGQMSAHLRWYRANLPPEAFVSDPPILPPIQVPALGVWSTGDVALSEEQMKNSAQYCDAGFTYRRLEAFGHWVLLEAPGLVAEIILEFFQSP